MAHQLPEWLHIPCRLEVAGPFGAEGTIIGGPQVNWVATTPVPPRGRLSL